ncbi:MAG: CBS domain-containing protein [Chloroflexi bacterium]|nr:CBS domain-containing protein [Chloroflexota bacterium]
MAINASWHRNNRMPRDASLDQRVRWHIDHTSHCACVPIPATVLEEIGRRHRDASAAPREVPVDRTVYLADDSSRTYRFLRRNPNWADMDPATNDRNKASLVGYKRIFRNGTTRVDTDLATAARLMIERNIGCLPVVDRDGMLAGMLTERLLQAQLAGSRPASSMGLGERTVLELYGGNPRGVSLAEDTLRMLGTRTAGDNMIDNPVEVASSTPLWTVAGIMLREHVSHIAVTENGRPIGVIARHDLVRALAGDREASPPGFAGYV